MTLSSLLENDFYLNHILKQLVDYGVHECRLVCHRWKRICDTLPLKLSRKEISKLLKVAIQFPKAVSVAFAIEPLPRTSTKKLYHQELCQYFRFFEKLKEIHSLELEFTEKWVFLDSTADFSFHLEHVREIRVLKSEDVCFPPPPETDDGYSMEHKDIPSISIGTASFFNRIVSLFITTNDFHEGRFYFSLFPSLTDLKIAGGTHGYLFEHELIEVDVPF